MKSLLAIVALAVAVVANRRIDHEYTCVDKTHYKFGGYKFSCAPGTVCVQSYYDKYGYNPCVAGDSDSYRSSDRGYSKYGHDDDSSKHDDYSSKHDDYSSKHDDYSSKHDDYSSSSYGDSGSSGDSSSGGDDSSYGQDVKQYASYGDDQDSGYGHDSSSKYDSDRHDDDDRDYSRGKYRPRPECRVGEYGCVSEGGKKFKQCDHGKWVIKSCAYGTVCYTSLWRDEHVSPCGWPKKKHYDDHRY